MVTHQKSARLLVGKKHTQNEKVVELPQSTRSRVISNLDKILWKFGIKIGFRNFFGIPDSYHCTFKMLRKLTAYQEADIVHLHNIHGCYFDLSALFKIEQDKPIVWTSHDEWIITGGEGYKLENRSQSLRDKYPYFKGLIDSRERYLRLKKDILSNASNIHVVAPSETHRKNILKVHPSISIKVIRYGIDTNKFFIRNNDKKRNEISKIIIFNTKSYYKNSEMAIEAVREINVPVELHVIGLPLSKFDIKTIKNHGYIQDRKNLADLFRNMDIGVISSYAETFGLLPAEMAACGVKVFLNESLPVFHEHFELYSATLYRDKAHLVEMIHEAVKNPDKTRAEGRLAAEMVVKNLNRQQTLENYDLLYREILN